MCASSLNVCWLSATCLRGFTSQKTKAGGRELCGGWGPGGGALRPTGLPASPLLASPLPGPGSPVETHRIHHPSHPVSSLTCSCVRPTLGPPLLPAQLLQGQLTSAVIRIAAPNCWALPSISPVCLWPPTLGPTPTSASSLSEMTRSVKVTAVFPTAQHGTGLTHRVIGLNVMFLPCL